MEATAPAAEPVTAPAPEAPPKVANPAPAVDPAEACLREVQEVLSRHRMRIFAFATPVGVDDGSVITKANWTLRSLRPQ